MESLKISDTSLYSLGLLKEREDPNTNTIFTIPTLCVFHRVTTRSDVNGRGYTCN